jgi:hypothetical protein
MSPLLRRRIALLVTAVAAIAALVVWQREALRTLRDVGAASGWLLAGLCLLLAGLAGRKRLAPLPIGRVHFWLQLHGWLGIVCCGAYVVHAGVRPPAGLLDRLLALSFVLTAFSGVGGAWFSRHVARRLQETGAEIVWERIPAARRELALQADQIVRETMAASTSTTLGEYHTAVSLPYLAAPHDRWAHLFGRSAALRARERRLADERRFLDETERGAVDRLQPLLVQKRQLDLHYTLQAALKLWLFLHIGATGALLVLAALHAAVHNAWRLT